MFLKLQSFLCRVGLMYLPWGLSEFTGCHAPLVALLITQWLSFCLVQTETQIHGFMEHFYSAYCVLGPELDASRQSVMAQSGRSHCHEGPRHTSGEIGPLCDGWGVGDNGTPRTIVEKA